MRFMITFRIPTEKGNALARDGKLGQTIQSIVEEINPEVAYFADMDGARGCIVRFITPSRAPPSYKASPARISHLSPGAHSANRPLQPVL